MPKKKIFLIVGFILVFCTSFPSSAQGCAACVSSIFDRILPPVNMWCIFTIAWFMAVSASYGIQRFLKDLVIVIVLCFLFSSFLGPLALVPLFLYSLIKSITAFFQVRKKTLTHRLRIAVGVFGILIVAVLTFYSSKIKGERTLSDYILQWETVWGGRTALKALNEKPSTSLHDLRTIIQKSRYSETLEIVSASLAEVGKPVIDVPLIINALESVRADQNSNLSAVSIEEALRKLSGIELPKDTSVEMWQKEWEVKFLHKNLNKEK